MGQQLQKYKDDWILFLEAGFMAAHQADEDAAVKLFRAAKLLNPENSLPKIGFGYVHFLKLELKQAAAIFEEVINKEPNNEMAKALLGLTLALTPTQGAKGEKLLHHAATKSGDPAIKTMANTAIEFIERFVKKTPTPVQMMPEGPKKGK
jgi:hypothetical protein